MLKHEKEMIENITSAATWAAEYIAQYQKNGADFDPFALLAGTDNRQSKIFTESIAFLHDLEEIAENYRKTRDKITFS